MDSKTIHLILLLLGVGLGVAISAHGEAPAPFFKKNVAKCFYCPEDAEIESGFETSSNVKESDEKSATTNIQPIVGVDPKSPIPFQKLVKAYESGDVNETYRAARAWVEYQDRIMKRTSDLAAMVTKAKKEVESEALMMASEVTPESAKKEESSVIRLAFLFNTKNPQTESAAESVQQYYRSTLADSTIEVFGVPSFDNQLEDLKMFKQAIGINFPVQYNRTMENEYEANGTPMVLAFKDNQKQPCKLEGSITSESIQSLVDQCRTSTSTLRRMQ
jgi:hypothetical protein